MPKNKKINNKDKGLFVGIKDGQLVISVGVNVLAFALQEGLEWQGEITSPVHFAKDVLTVLNYEDEIGQTPVHKLLDKAGYDASEISDYIDLDKKRTW